jgi:flagellar hook-length control protein FliK
MMLIKAVVPNEFQDLNFALGHIDTSPHTEGASSFDDQLLHALNPEEYYSTREQHETTVGSSATDTTRQPTDKLDENRSVEPPETNRLAGDDQQPEQVSAPQGDREAEQKEPPTPKSTEESGELHAEEPTETSDGVEHAEKPDYSKESAGKHRRETSRLSQVVFTPEAGEQVALPTELAQAEPGLTKSGKVPVVDVEIEVPGDEMLDERETPQKGIKTAVVPSLEPKNPHGRTASGNETPRTAKTTSDPESGRQTFKIVDLRTKGGGREQGADPRPDARKGNAGPAAKVEPSNQSDAGRTQPSELTAPSARSSEHPGRDVVTREQVLTSLANKLRDQLNSEIVRSARMIIRSSDSGQIRLNLRPESLGSVRIMLQLKEGHIAGRIIVENSSVRQVFEQNLPHLSRAFQEGGLDLDNLDVAVADSGAHGGQGEADFSNTESAERSADGFGQAVPDYEVMEIEHGLVNLIV